MLQGTLDLLVLQTLPSMGSLHGYGIARRIERVSVPPVATQKYVLRYFLICVILLIVHRPSPAHPGALTEACHAAGLRVTPQRLAVLRVLMQSHDHPAPEAVFQRVKGDLPSVSLATVYKVLASLEAAGLASRVGVPGDANRYDANRAPHHHLICTRCGDVADHEDPDLAPALPRQLGGFVPSEARVQIFGLCARCRPKTRK